MRCRLVTEPGGEEGLFSAFFLFFLVTLGLMGLGAYALIRAEGQNAVINIESARAQYAANGAAYYGMKRLELGALDESTALDIGGAVVQLDTSRTGREIDLNINAAFGSLHTQLCIHLLKNDLTGFAIYSTGDVINTEGRDSLNNADPSVITQNEDSIPSFDMTTLAALSTAQGHDQSGNFKPGDGYPTGSFFQADGVTPNVTWVAGNMTVLGGRQIWGIFIIEGKLTMNGGCSIDGVVYLLNDELTKMNGTGDPMLPSISGGVITEGDILGTGSHVIVTNVPDYMRSFVDYLLYDPPPFTVLQWEYK